MPLAGAQFSFRLWCHAFPIVTHNDKHIACCPILIETPFQNKSSSAAERYHTSMSGRYNLLMSTKRAVCIVVIVKWLASNRLQRACERSRVYYRMRVQNQGSLFQVLNSFHWVTCPSPGVNCWLVEFRFCCQAVQFFGTDCMTKHNFRYRVLRERRAIAQLARYSTLFICSMHWTTGAH